jgi:hypothetical protein
MRTSASSIAVAAIAIALTVPAALGATANRTWVSHSGLSGNAGLNPPCTPTNPCDTFATALGATNAGGEINCLDNGSYGAVAIAKSVTIDCDGQLGAIDAVASSNGVTINSATAVVKLRKLTINGNGGIGSGVSIQSAAAVIIENCVIQNFTGSQSLGIAVQSTSSNASQLSVSDTLIVNNTDGANNAGLLISNNGSGPISFALDRVRVEHNASYGVAVSASGTSTGTVAGVIRDSVVTGSGFSGILADAFTAPATVSLDHTHVAGNGTGVISTNGAAVILNNSTVQTNHLGLSAGGGAIFSYDNNAINGNQPGGNGSTPTSIALH